VRRALLIASIAFSTLLGPMPGHADTRVALVIGNSTYGDRDVSRLANPANDARLMAETLRDLGFSLVGGGAQLDLEKRSFDRAVKAFGEAATNADVALFYFAGHAIEVRGTNYLLPVDAGLNREADLEIDMLNVNLVLYQMEDAHTRLNVVILDACRNNPFGGRGTRAVGIGSGLASMETPDGTLIAFATSPGKVAFDVAGSNSPYTTALAATLRQPGLGLFDTFNQVANVVSHETGGTQVPWFSSSRITGSFYFSAPSAGAGAADEIVWNVVKDTTDISALRRFIAEYPSSARLDEARARIAALETAGARRKAEGALGTLAAAVPPVKPGAPSAASPRRATTAPVDPCDGAGDHWRRADAIGSLPALEEHLARFPNCAFGGLAKSKIAALAAPTAPAADVRRFDGIWITKAVCESKPPIWPVESFQFSGLVRNGVFHGQIGDEGKPSSRSYDGKIGPDGIAEILIKGFTGDTERDPLHRPIGTEYRWKIAGRFEGSHGTGIRADERTCNFDFAMLAPTGSGATQRFDGFWITSVVCDGAPPDVLGWSHKFIGRVKSGEFRGQVGADGKPGWTVYSGTIDADGDVEIHSKGLTAADSKVTLNHLAGGSSFSWRAVGRFENSEGSAIRVEGRTCNLKFTRTGQANAASPKRSR
jgi:uncharacterized caspase-like protein